MTAMLKTIADQIRDGKFEQAGRALDATTETNENRVEVTFLRGYLQEMTLDRTGALKTYRRVLEMNPDHTEAGFRSAILSDVNGDDETAMAMYQRCTSVERAPINALINLAILYEDNRRLADAERCLQHVLTEHPNHHRAAQLLKSVNSSYTMMYDERKQREDERRDAILDTPISDFELSVRSRNCLRQMNIRTLGDLLRTTESELLAYKNFGETSLNEIKAMLTQKGLELDQALQIKVPQPAMESPVAAVETVTPHMHIPVSTLELSVRSRKCLQRLGISTLGDLARRTEAELINTKNFGDTSLNEIKKQLAAHGLAFRSSF